MSLTLHLYCSVILYGHYYVLCTPVHYICLVLQADRERALRQREYLAQLEEDSEPTSLATTTEGEHTVQVRRIGPA